MTTDLLDPIVQQVLSTLQQPQLTQRPIVLAYSGGVDSQVLLHCLALLQGKQLISVPISLIHINHGLSVNAVQWQAVTEQQALNYGFRYQCIAVQLEPDSQQSLEALAREARYQAINQYSQENCIVLTAHHQDDQLETMLLALKRGAGVQGLSAMQSVREFCDNKLLVRPLLSVSRNDIEVFAARQKLSWVEDESNEDQRFDRNFLRLRIIPLLHERWPQINQTASRSAGHCQQAQQLLDELAQTDLVNVKISKRVLSVSGLLQLTPARLTNVLRYFIHLNKKLAPSSQQLEQIQTSILTAKTDKNPYLQLSGYSLRRYKQQLHLCNTFNDVTAWLHSSAIASLSEGEIIQLPDGLGSLNLTICKAGEGTDQLFCQALNDEQTLLRIAIPDDTEFMTIMFRHDNPKCLPDYRQQRRSLKKILQEQDVPVWQRKRTPFITFDNEFAAALPLFVCKEYVASNERNCLNIIWTKS